LPSLPGSRPPTLLAPKRFVGLGSLPKSRFPDGLAHEEPSGARGNAIWIGRGRVVNEAEAVVVRRIFELCAQGYGHGRIARALTAEAARPPRGDAWPSTVIREMLAQDAYRGVLIYGRTAWERRGGTRRKVRVKDQSKWIRKDAPELRIVSEELWNAAHARIARTRQTYTGRRNEQGQLNGRPETGLAAQHLLSGFLRCGLCGGNLVLASRSDAGKARLTWRCATHHRRGTCGNRYGVPYGPITEAILGHLRESVFRPAVLGRLLTEELEKQAKNPDEAKAERQALEADIKRLDREVARLVEAVTAGGDDVRPLVAAMKAKQGQRDTLAAQLEHLDGLEKARETFDVVAWLEETRELLEDLRDTLEADPTTGRGVLRWLAPGAGHSHAGRDA
jgi:site-specific DNA recombinase